MSGTSVQADRVDRAVASDVTADDFRDVLGHLPTGVCIITASDPRGRPHGMSCNSLTSVSLTPPLVGFFPARSSTTWPTIRAASRFAVNVLAEDQHELCRRFASRGIDRFAGVAWERSPRGTPLLADTVAWLDCEIFDEHPAGDHTCVLGTVHELSAQATARPLIFLRGGFAR